MIELTDAMQIDTTINGRRRVFEIAVHHTLLDVLRDELNLTGTKECCVVGEWVQRSWWVGVLWWVGGCRVVGVWVGVMW